MGFLGLTITKIFIILVYISFRKPNQVNCGKGVKKTIDMGELDGVRSIQMVCLRMKGTSVPTRVVGPDRLVS